MVANPDKFQLMFLGLNEKHKLRFNIEGVKISSSKNFKLLGIEIDNQLRFNKHIKTQCDNTSRKVSAFRRLNIYLSKKISSFNYCHYYGCFVAKMPIINKQHSQACFKNTSQ